MEIEFELMTEKYAEQFLEIARDTVTRRYIVDFDAPETEIVQRISGLNAYPEIGRTFAIIEGEEYIGYLMCKKSADLYDKLQCSADEWEEVLRAEKREKGPVTIDIAIHPNQRGKGYGKKALEKILEKMKREGNLVIHFEVNTKNTYSLALMKSIGAEFVLDWINGDETIRVFEYRF